MSLSARVAEIGNIFHIECLLLFIGGYCDSRAEEPTSDEIYYENCKLENMNVEDRVKKNIYILIIQFVKIKKGYSHVHFYFGK